MQNLPDNKNHLVHALVNDLGGITRGRAFPDKKLQGHLDKGIGWVPINQTISAFDEIPYPGQWGPVGDCRLIPDPATKVYYQPLTDTPPLHFYLSDVVALNGKPHDICSRTFLKTALKKLEKHGISLIAAFEHEFVLQGDEKEGNYAGFSLRKSRQHANFGNELVNAMDSNGLAPETFLPEFGENQFEVTNSPFPALQAADNAVKVRELVKEVAANFNAGASFSPKFSPDSQGSGVHIHFSLQDLDGNPITYDANKPSGMSDLAGSFCAGILKHLPAMSAFLTPGVVSYQRLKPQSWSAAYACLGDSNREAALRIAPTFATTESKRAKQYNVELRVVDACANPYLALGTLIMAGLEGLNHSLDTPPIINQDPDEMSAQDRAKFNIVRLPDSLDRALKVWQEDNVAFNWLPDSLRTGYLDMKLLELEKFKQASNDAVCEAYRQRY
ncbi:MAG: glutamine synthetase family protein [Psychrobium sp.]